MTTHDDKVMRVEGILDSLDTKKVDHEVEPLKKVSPNKEQFDSLLSLEQQKAKEPKVDPIEAPSLMDQVREINHKVDAVSKASPKDLIAKAEEVIRQIESVKETLATPNLELKGSVQTLLKNKLSHIDENLKVALNRTGVEYVPEAINPQNNLVSPIERFIGFLTHGQNQLQQLAQNVEMMHLNQKDINPATMLAIQIKVGYVQQEIELFTNMLNKSLESIKTIMNVQI